MPIEKNMPLKEQMKFNLEAENDIYIDHSIVSTGDNALGFTAKAAAKIIVNDGVGISTNGGDIILWSNSGNITSGAGEHFIRLDAGTTLNSDGGNIVLAGGIDSNSDGYPDGYAYIGDSVVAPGRFMEVLREPLHPSLA